jgi:hypothetical protein
MCPQLVGAACDWFEFQQAEQASNGGFLRDLPPARGGPTPKDRINSFARWAIRIIGEWQMNNSLGIG